jgi:hypothetical protein
MTRDELVLPVIGRIGDGGVTLVRPDGIVAARSREGTAEYLHRLTRELVPA